jgi:alginate O-acetyltransferase complex protein AlgI
MKDIIAPAAGCGCVSKVTARSDDLTLCFVPVRVPNGVLMDRVIVSAALIVAAVAAMRVSRRRRVRQLLLALCSVGFYVTWTGAVAGILLLSIFANYLFGRWIRGKPETLPLSIGVLFNLLLLGTFKYLPGLVSHLPLLPALHLEVLPSIALPLGISFWTFQALSYLLDLYRGEEHDPSPLEFLLYMAFFPVVISGPICRMGEMLPQFRSSERVRWADAGEGLRRVAIGVLMMQVARVLGQGAFGAIGITAGFDRMTSWSAVDAWVLAAGFGLQLFFDFAGYSHIAVGLAKALGFSIPENFDRPFASGSPSVFWTRWHISLSFWVRDYVFLPLAGVRRAMSWRYFALLTSMIVFGVWHKATLLFFLWGTYHGLLLVAHRQVQVLCRRLEWNGQSAFWKASGWLSTTIFVAAGWILFRSNSLDQAGRMISQIVLPSAYGYHLLPSTTYLLVAAIGLGYGVTVSLAGAFEQVQVPVQGAKNARTAGIASLARTRWYWMPAIYVLFMLLLLLVTLGSGDTAVQLMYRAF